MEEAASKAQRMVGLGPMKPETVEKYMKEDDDFEVVKIKVVQEHLRNIYKYNDKGNKKPENKRN